jgi:voltage-gated potassium channel Kch
MFLSIVLVFILGPLAKNKIISYRAAKWVAVCTAALTVIPAGAIVMWSFAIGLTSIYSIFTYFGFVAYEIKNKEEQKNGGDKN